MPATRASDKKARSLAGSDRNNASSPVFGDENKEPVGPVGSSQSTEGVTFPSEAEDTNSRKKRRPLNWEKDNRPPRPANAFISFKSSLKDGPQKHEYAARLANGENIGVIAQQMWKGLTDDERDQWYVAAKKAKVEHGKKYPDYKYQPQRRKDKKKPRRRNARSVDPDDDYEEEEEEQSDAASGAGQSEETGTSILTPSSDFSEDDKLIGIGEPRLVEVYMGGNEDLDRLYKNGWKWALIRDYDMPTLEATAGLDDKNPMVHVPNSIDRLPSTPEADPTANPLAIELISMASVLSNIEHPPEMGDNVFHPPGDPALFQQMFSPWDYPPPQSSAFFYDGQPALEMTESILKLEAST